MAVVIRGVPEDIWREFKAAAARRGKKNGEFLVELIRNYNDEKKKARKAWEKILNRKPTLSDEDAEAMLRYSKEFRENFRLRI